MSAPLSIICANTHNHRGPISWLRARSVPTHPQHYNIGLTSECHKRSKSLGRFQGHHYLTGPLNGGTGTDKLTKNLTQDCGILLDNRLPVLGHTFEFMSPANHATEHVGHERWGQSAFTMWGDHPLGIISMHPIPQPGSDRYVKAIQWLDAEVDRHVALGRDVIAGGDWQISERSNALYSPKQVFANHKMQWHWSQVMAVAWTRGLVLERAKTLDQFRQTTGHPMLRVALSLNPRRAR
jgi:hypothetical protein